MTDWVALAEPTVERIERARRDGRADDAAALARQLVDDAQEIHDLLADWARRLPELLGEAPPPLEAFERGWAAFVAGCSGFGPDTDLDALVAIWRAAHDHALDRVATLVDRWVDRHGEARLGELWRELQRDGIAFYRGAYGPDRPWAESFDRLLRVAIDGMHGHLGGPRGRGEVAVAVHDDRVSLTFAPCGSGGRVLDGGSHGVVVGAHDFAWSTPGVCRYCVHCCVLQQQGAIDLHGYPARVIDPPTEPGAPCTWTVYRDPALVPDSAYERVGRSRRG